MTGDADKVDRLYELHFQHQKLTADFTWELTLAEGYSLGGTSDLIRTVERGIDRKERQGQSTDEITSLASPRSSEMTSQ
jgi:hypothetical protein